MVDFAGWRMPIQYAGILEEHRAVRERAGLFDLCHMGELFVDGPDAGDAVAVTAAAEAIYLADSSSGLVGISITQTIDSTVVVSHTLDTLGSALDVAVAGDYAYVAVTRDPDHPTTNGMAIVNRFPPEGMEQVGWIATPGKASALVVQGETAYLADGDSGIVIVSIADPAAPKVVGALDTEGTSEQIALAGRYAFVADGAAGDLLNNATDLDGNPRIKNGKVDLGAYEGWQYAFLYIPIAKK